MTILQEWREAKSSALTKANRIVEGNLGVSGRLDLLAEISIEIGEALELAIEELERQENRYEFIESLGRRN